MKKYSGSGKLGLMIVMAATGAFAQDTGPMPTPKPTAAAKTSQPVAQVSRERREQAFAKLMEGQRFIWSMGRLGSQAGIAASTKYARQAFQKAVELDPNLAEGYTALADLAWRSAPNDYDEAIILAGIAAKLNKDNFGAHRVMARVYTIKSGLNTETVNNATALKAIEAWKEVARLDPRNAEAWAFLSELYAATNNQAGRIEALQNWLGSNQPVEAWFIRALGYSSFAPERATVRLGEAYLKEGKNKEAVEILSRAISSNPQDQFALDLMSQAVANVDKETALKAVGALQQAIYANSENLELVETLSKLLARIGKTEEAVRSMKSIVERYIESDKAIAANLQFGLAEIYLEDGRDAEAIGAFEEALKINEIGGEALDSSEKRDFAILAFNRIIQVYSIDDRFEEAKAANQRLRILLGKNDTYADKQYVNLLRDSGRKQEALIAVRALRKKVPLDFSLTQLEATILTDMGKVDQGVGLIKPLINAKASTGPIGMFDDFNNLIFISSLYSNAKRGKEAVAAANQAHSIAKSEDARQVAKLVLATAQQRSGDFQASEATLRAILKQAPESPVVLNNLGYFLVERNEKIDEAKALIEKALKFDPSNGSFLDSLGWAYFKQNNLVLAEKYIRDALRRSPSSAAIQEHLGDILDKKGDKDAAKSAWQRALILSGDPDQIKKIKLKMNKGKKR